MRNKKRLNFGVIFNTFDDPCAYDTWNGIVAYAQKNDIQLTAYVGVYETTGYSVVSHYETCFDAIRKNTLLDGLIILSGFIAHDMKHEVFMNYIKSIPKNLPLISLVQYIPGISSVIVDNMGGMYDVTDHLIRVHGKRKIAFVKGPGGLDEAEERLEGYRAALKDNGLSYNESLVVPGDFNQKSGQFAVRKLLKMRKGTFDAIIASNDRTAVGVINELDKNGLLVPLDVAVAGFDDAWFAETFIPSISTAKQDFFELGSIGAKTLRRMIDKKSVDEVTYVSPTFIKRQSCGCMSTDFSGTAFGFAGEQMEADSLKSYLIKALVPLFKGDISEKKTQQWAAALADKITEKPYMAEDILDLVSELLLNYNHFSASKNYSLWNDVLNILTMGTEMYSDEIEDAYITRLTFIHAATLVEAYKFKEVKTNEYKMDDDRRRLRRVAGNLMLHNDTKSLSKELQLSLFELKIYTALIGLYSAPINKRDRNADRNIETIIGIDGGLSINAAQNEKPVVFADYLTIPSFDYERNRRDLMFYPLFFGDEELGVMLISYNAEIPVDTYETLRTSISSAVKGMDLLSKVQTLSITDDHTGLYNRRGFFQMANSRLTHYSRRKELIPLVMFMDMDGLKYINDNYGHSEGDVALLEFSRILKQALREEDIIGRIGGDEFVVFSAVDATENPRESAKLIEKRLRDKLDEYNKLELHPYQVMGSIGSVLLESPTRECLEAAILTADDALYEEKTEKKKKGYSRAD